MRKKNIQPPEWINDEIPLGELIGKEWQDNPRMSTDEDLQGISDSWETFGQVESVAVGPGGNLYNGHQRLKYLVKSGYPMDYKVAVRRSSRELDEEEKHKLTLYLHAGATGRWNWQKLETWPKDELREHGFGKNFQERLRQEFEKIQELFGEDAGEGVDSYGENGGQGDGEPQEESDGSMLKLLNVTIDEPRHKVEHGQIYNIGKHTLICVNVLTEWEIWKPHLKGDAIFAPYPGPFVPLSRIAEKKRIVLVQPDPYIAGHILDSYEEVMGPGSVKLAK